MYRINRLELTIAAILDERSLKEEGQDERSYSIWNIPKCPFESLTNRVMRWPRKILPIKIIRDDEEGYLYNYQNIMSFFSRDKNGCSVWSVICTLLVVWTFLVFIGIGILQLRYDQLLLVYKPQVKPEASFKSERCALNRDIYQPNMKLYNELSIVATIVHRWSICPMPGNGFSLIYITAGSLLMFAFITGYLTCLSDKLIFEPKVEQFTKFAHQVRKDISIESRKLVNQTLFGSDNLSIQEIHLLKSEFHQYLSSPVKYRYLDQVDHFIMPNCFLSNKENLYIWARFITCVASTVFGIFLLGCANTVLLRENFRLGYELRKQLMKCQTLMPDAILIRNPTLDATANQWPIEKNHMQAFLEYPKSSLNYYYYDLIDYMTLNRMILFVPLNFVIIYCAFWFCYNLATVADCFFMKMFWSAQVIKEMRLCLEALRLFPDYSNNLQNNVANIMKSDIEQINRLIRGRIELQHKRLVAALLVTYCNFELLRRAHRYYASFLQYFAYVCWSILISVTLLTYSLYSKAQDFGMLYVVLLVGLTTVTTNGFYVICVLITYRYQRIYGLLNEIVGNIPDTIRQNQYHLIHVLNRHTLFDSDVQTLFSTKLFGIALTRSSVISLNTYTIGAIAILCMRVMG